MKKKKIFKIFIIGIITLFVLVIVFAKYKHISPLAWNMYSEINQGVFTDEAIEGYDAVAYYTQQKAVKGEKSIFYKWKDATWYFSSQENINLFKQNPEKYAPQFGGYCSFAVSTGFTAKIDPEAWIVKDGKLYLFNDQGVKSKWMENPEENLKKDIGNWRGSK